MASSSSISNRGTTEEFFLQVARGQIGGHRVVLRSGLNRDIDTGTDESLWDQGGLYVFPPSASAMTVSSSSANDTAAGTGARTVLVTGLNASYVEQQEIITLNGQSAVTTVNSYLRVFSATVLTAGSGETNAGDVYTGTGTVTAGVPAVVYLKIPAGFGATQAAQYTVPAGYTAYLVDIIGSCIASSTNQHTLLSIRARPQGGVFVRGGHLVVSGAVAYLGSVIPRSFPEKTDIDAIATTTDTNVTAAATLRYLLVQNSLDA